MKFKYSFKYEYYLKYYDEIWLNYSQNYELVHMTF